MAYPLREVLAEFRITTADFPRLLIVRSLFSLDATERLDGAYSHLLALVLLNRLDCPWISSALQRPRVPTCAIRLVNSSRGRLRTCSLACSAVPNSDTACPEPLAAICQRRRFSLSFDILVPVLPPSQHLPVHTALLCPHPTVSYPFWFDPTP